MASVSFRLRSPAQPHTTIICRFYSRETGAVDISTSETIPSEFWQGQRVSARYKKNHDRINRSLSELECDLLDIWRQNKGADRETLKALVTQRVKGQASGVEKKTVVEAIQKFITQYESEKETATVKVYKSILKKIEAFNPALTFDHLDFNFYDAFKKFLYSQPNGNYTDYRAHRDSGGDTYTLHPYNSGGDSGDPVGLFDDTVYKYVVRLKTICEWAEKRGYTPHTAYKEWQIIRRNYAVISLTLEELQRLEALTGLPRHLEIARDYFSIMCRTGQRISDAKRISALAIHNGIWTILQKKGSRVKQKEVHLPLKGFCAPVVDIIEKHGGRLPELSEQHLNRHIKELCKRAGITQDIFIERWQGSKKIRIPGKKYEFISCHSGKRTFVTVLGGQGVPVKVISDLTGTSIKTIERHYLGKTDLYIVDNYLVNIENNQINKTA